MDILCASSGIVWHKKPKKGIREIKEGGFGGIMLDIAACCPPGELEFLGRKSKTAGGERKNREEVRISEHPEEMGGCLEVLLEECGRESVPIQAALAPFLGRDTMRKDLGGLLKKLAEESIRVCGQAGCKYLIIKPLSGEMVHGGEWEANREYYLGLADLARRNNVMILLENLCRDRNGHLVRGLCSDGEEAALWTDRLNAEAGEERFGFCMDVGACSLCGQDMREFAVTLGGRIRAVVLRDCDGLHDNSLIPFTCMDRGRFKTDWLNLVRGLREIGFDGPLIMDFGSMAGAVSQFLRPRLIGFAHSVAFFLQWQISIKNVLRKYESRVLFGAGNMCRNYMKCYGREFPPLFTCDNNSARWGERFEGLEIRSPESLKELPPDCAIFICNIYYREIEGQLREMGISNPIEYFNDEYMPSYYFDRLEYWEETDVNE